MVVRQKQYQEIQMRQETSYQLRTMVKAIVRKGPIQAKWKASNQKPRCKG